MTSKLKLDVEALEVTSFDTDAAAGERGTVLGASGIEPAPESDGLCIDSYATGACCEYSLALSCVQTNCDECTAGPDLMTLKPCPA